MKLMNIILAILLLNLGLFANVRTNNLSEDELNKQLEAEALLRGEDTSGVYGESKKDSEKTSSSKDNDDKYRDIALYNFITRYDNENDKKTYPITLNNKVMVLADNVSVHNQKMKELQDIEDKKKAEQEKEENQTKTIYFTGYCFTRNAIEVENIQGYGIIDCSFEDNDLNISTSKMMAMFIPITSRNALISKPIYLLGKDNKKIPIQTGVILTLDRTSLNVANFINDKKMKKLTGDLMSQTGDIALNQSVAYLNQLEESNKREEVVLNSSISGTTQTKTTNTEAPDATTYLVHSGIQFISGLFKLGGLLLSEDKYPLFKVYQDSGFYVDFVVEINGDKKGKVTKESKELERIDYQDKAYEESNKPISIGEDVTPQKLQLPSSPLGK